MVTNGGVSKATKVIPLHIPRLSKKVAETQTFKDFLASLSSIGKVNDNDNVSIFTERCVTVHKEEDVLIANTVKAEPVMIWNKRQAWPISNTVGAAMRVMTAANTN